MIKKLLCVLAMLFATATAWAAVEVNKADQATLESVKGIGTKMSTRILDERKKSPFKDWSDLMARVKGVKEGAATKLSKEGLTVNGASYQAAAVTATPAAKKGDTNK
ncbi:ComEA family DNA-binding protein [Sphaerotilaceae bacterium SBD11-9]